MSDTLERQLVALAHRIDTGAGDRLVVDVLARLDDAPSPVAPRRARVAVVLAIAAALVLLALAVPGPRRTVAHWFGIGSTRIDVPPVSLPTPTFPATLDLGAAASPSEAAARTGLPVPSAPALGEPAALFVATPPQSGQIVAVYRPSASLPESPMRGVGALLSAMPGSIRDGLFLKVAPDRIDYPTFTTSAGAVVSGVWLGGSPHTYVFEDADGTPVFDTLRLATNTLLWQDGDVTYRLEASIPEADAIRIAMTVHPG
jgi:hypothetical protein